ncbi:unnamed protein product [Meloidogyne enterolobii]|uniref:Uncharacterized protein n=1 Tax=Meloidogyne enterolobii TaxID=390850 RepID=A0ACB1A2A8_MELEN
MVGTTGLSPSTISSSTFISPQDPTITKIQQQQQPTPYLFHQTSSGSTLCQLGGDIIEQQSQQQQHLMMTTTTNMCCSPSSSSGSQPHLVPLSGSICGGGVGGGANDSGLSSLSGIGGSGCFGTGTNILLHPHNFSPDVRGDLEELEPVPRDRCNTWPMRRAMSIEGQAQTSPLIHDRIPEEESSIYDEDADCVVESYSSNIPQRGITTDPLLSGGIRLDGLSHQQSPTFDEFTEEPLSYIEDRPDSALGGDSSRAESPLGGGQALPCSSSASIASKKSSTRRNAWGNMSYADLITQAILASPEQRLTLSQVYEWMVHNVAYFRDKGDSNSSAGWKNSIRHNLSLHSRFMRIQNEGAGKSSWWVINPDAKPGRNPRRRANTMENSSKTAMDRKRRGTARKRVEHLNKDIKHEDCYSMEAASLQDLSYPNDICHEEMPCGTNAEMVGGGVCVVGEGPICGGGGGVAGSVNNNFMFRPRANSTLSVTGGNTRFSPNLETSACIEDIDFPPWMEQQQMEGQQQQILNPQVSELLDRTGQMRLDGRRPMRPTFQRNGNGALIRVNNKRHSSLIPLATSPQNNPLVVPKTEIDVEQKIIKQEAIAPPPSYQELSAVRGSLPQQMQNPLLLRMGEHQQQQMMTPMKMNSIPSSTSVASQSFPVSIFTSTNGQQQMFSPDNNNFQQWNRQPPNTFPQHINPMASNNGQIMFPGGGIIGGENNNNNGTSLPFDLESVNAMPVDQQAFADLDVDAVLRHELAQGGQFDLP